MNTSAKILVLEGARFACLRITGRANFTSSIDFKAAVNQLSQKGCDYVVLDLSECLFMDSTFLGVLAGFGLSLNEGQTEPGGRAVELLNPNPHITESLDNLGVIHLFKLTAGPLTLPEATQVCRPASPNPSREEITRACLEAHQTLMAINSGNLAKFKDVAQFLADDLERLKAAP